MDVPRGQHLTTRVEEGRTNNLLVNLVLKSAALTRAVRMARVVFRNAPAELGYWFEDDVKGAAIADISDVIKDRFITGMGVLAVGSDGGSFLMYVDPLDVWWSPEFGYRNPSWVIRRIALPSREVFEYWDTEKHAYFTDGELLHEEENPLQAIPVRFVENVFSVPGIAFPKGDVEQALPIDMIANKSLQALRDYAEHALGFIEYQQDAVDPLELEKLSEPGLQYIGTQTGVAFQPRVPPPINPVWLTLYGTAKSEMDAHTGVSDYLRGSMPVANNIRFATQVLAALGAQNLRIDADWVPLKEMLEWAAWMWLMVAHANGERHRVGDIVVDAGEIDITQVSVKLEEDENAFSVSEVGINPDELQRVLTS
jgi:hypothetical protein